MPARRSRTAGWRESLNQLHERNGSIEIAVARAADDEEPARDLVWRVRVLGVTETEILIEQPITLGQAIEIEPGVRLVGIYAVGQNRWMFSTVNLGPITSHHDQRRPMTALRLELPTGVRRCQRRHHERMDTAGLQLPELEGWPLLDPRSVLPAERANELQFESGGAGLDLEAVRIMPDVGPRFSAMLLNIGGGGMGIAVGPNDAPVLGRRRLIWLRFALPPAESTPICATAKIVHTHIESDKNTYAGISFDFSFNPAHEKFVVDQIRKSIAYQQEQQRLELPVETRKSA